MKKTTLASTLAVVALLLAACSTPVDLSEPSASRSTASGSSADAALNGSPAGLGATGQDEYRCDADPAQSLLGQTVNSDVEAEAKALSGAKTVRTLRPKNVITMEYNPQRINLRVDEQDAITSVGCG